MSVAGQGSSVSSHWPLSNDATVSDGVAKIDRIGWWPAALTEDY